MKTAEITINVHREYVDRELDNVGVSIPLIETYGSKSEYAEITAELIGREFFPSKRTYSDNNEVSSPEGPSAFRVQFQTHSGATEISKVETALKLVRKLVKKFDAQLIRPKTFGETVALWAQVTGFPVRVIRPYKDFKIESLMGEDAHTISDPREVARFLDRIVPAITKTKRTALGLDPKPVEVADGEVA